jgi:glycosyltransferase involved in cell wall biosynthesis
LDACDVYVQPSLFESFGLSALEALARSRACMGSRVGGLASLLDACGLLFEVGNVEEIARCLRLLTDDHDLRRALGAAGRAKASGFTWERIVPQYEGLLLELIRT